jgi:hypothetical protein
MRGLDASFVEWGELGDWQARLNQTGQPAQHADEPGHGSILNSARFHHKFHLCQATRLSSPNVLPPTSFSQFISGSEINAGSAFQFDSNLILIEIVLVIATVAGATRSGTRGTP